MAKRVQFTCEYFFKASPAILFEFLIEPSYLGQWFADQVTEQDGIYDFNWSGSVEKARLLESSEENNDTKDEYVKYEWLDADEGEFLEFRISLGEVSGKTNLVISGFCEDDEVDNEIALWDTQVASLKKLLGG